MDLAYVVRRSFPGPGGIATAMRVVARELARQHRVRVWASRIDDVPLTRLNATVGAQVFQPFWVDGVEVRPVPMRASTLVRSTPMTLMTVPGLRRVGYGVLRKLTAPGYVKAVAHQLARDWESPDVVHCWGGEHTNWAAGEAARRAGVPFVVTPFAHPDAWGDDDMNVAFYKRARLVLALVPSEAAFYGTLGVDPGRVRVVGVPATPLPDGGIDIRERHGLGDDPLVLFLGVKEPYKGYRLLLEAAHLVWERHPRALFAFVGPPTDASRADFATVTDHRIIEVGRVEDAEVAAWHRAATVMCLPSTSEIMPVSILEAWQASTPVVAARWWCAADVIVDETDGLIVDPDASAIAGALDRLLAAPDTARAMGEAGAAKVAAEFSPAAVAARHLSVYREAGRA